MRREIEPFPRPARSRDTRGRGRERRRKKSIIYSVRNALAHPPVSDMGLAAGNILLERGGMG